MKFDKQLFDDIDNEIREANLKLSALKNARTTLKDYVSITGQIMGTIVTMLGKFVLFAEKREVYEKINSSTSTNLSAFS